MAILLFALLVLLSCTQTYDLQIRHAAVFDVRTGRVLQNKTILVQNDTIVAVADGDKAVDAAKTIDVGGKLVTPGMIDAHIHLTDIFGDYDAAPIYLPVDSLAHFRKKFSDTYLPYGVTSVLVLGQPENWLPPVLDWSAHPSANYTDIYTAGGAMISKESRKPYIGHITVESPVAARQKVLDYYKKGIRHAKLYWRLQKPEFEAACKTADSLGMRLYGHIDNGVMFLDSTLALGLKNYEHVFSLIHNINFSEADYQKFLAWVDVNYGKGKRQSTSFTEMTLIETRFVMDHKGAVLDSLLDRMAAKGATVSTTIHLFAEKAGQTFFANTANSPDTAGTNEQKKRSRDDFAAFMQLVKKVWTKGIPLRLGTDVADGGKAAVSEQLLLAQYGFSVADIIGISTINGAAALGLENKYGSVESGKKANLIIYDRSPFDHSNHFRAGRTVIKDGKVLPHTAAF